MLDKLIFAAGQFAALALVLAACWGFGRRLLGFAPAAAAVPPGLDAPLSITMGLAISICALQGLAIAGLLRAPVVAAFLAIGLVLGGIELIRRRQRPLRAESAGGWGALPFVEKCALAILALAMLRTALAPLAPPLVWDELMYHLPHAQQWASSGHLTVNGWLRYPWFPYNFDLLFAAALLFGNDVFPHLLHATAGWLLAWLIYRLGTRYLDRTTACLAAVLWILCSKSEYENAYVDMGVALFVFASCIALLQWRTTQARFWLASSAFFLGVAAGSKYQVLALLPFFALALLLWDRRPASWLIAILSFALPCAYWYVRNAIATGDPFSPIGGRLFGFTDWNPGDYRAQFENLRRNADWPHWSILPALLAPWIPALRNLRPARGAMVLCAWMLVVWVASSRYPRYLMSAYPLLALLAAGGWMYLLRRLWAQVAAEHTSRVGPWLGYLLVAGAGISAVASGAKDAARVAATPAARESLLDKHVTGYRIWTYLRAHPEGKTYQMGLEDSLYYAPQPVWGELFGPWRYADFMELSPEELHRKLSSQGFKAFVIHTQRMPQVTSKPGFENWFVPIRSEDSVTLYRLAARSTP